MVVRMRPDDLRRCLQPETLLGLYGLQFIEVMAGPIGEGLIGQRPQPLGGLLLVVAPGQGVDPVNGIARGHGDLRAGQFLRQQPSDLPVATRHGIFGPAVASRQLVKCEVRLD